MAYQSGDRRSSVYVVATQLYRRMESIEDVLTNVEFRNGIEHLGIIGEKTAKNKVISSGTAYSNIRQRYGLGGKGRVVTGRMLNAISYVIEKGTKQLRVRVGFIKENLDYFRLQEGGFWNVWKLQSFGRGTHGPNANRGFTFVRTEGRKTQGMFALRDAREKMLDESKVFSAKLRERIRKI
jgi:hypothetical protein